MRPVYLRSGIFIFCLMVASPTIAGEWQTPADPVAIQLYVFGEPAREPGPALEGVLTTVKKAGVQNIQAWLDYFSSDESTKTLSDLLNKHGIQMVAAYSGGVFHIADQADLRIQRIVERAKRGKEMGLKVVVVNPDPKPERKTDAELQVQAEKINILAESISALGLRLALHHHSPEMADGAREWRHILKHTNPGEVFFCLDLDWVLQGGQDPFEILAEAGNRLLDLHLRNSRNGIWTESIEEGDIDFKKVGDTLKASGYTGYLTIELAREDGMTESRNLAENLKRSRDFVREAFGK